MDAHKERISLGIKQLTEDFFESFASANPKGSKVSAEVKELGDEFISLTLGSDIPAVIRAKEIKDQNLEVGSSIEALITSIDKKERVVNLSIRALEKSEEKDLLKENVERNKEIEASSKTSIGDLIKDELKESSEVKDEEV